LDNGSHADDTITARLQKLNDSAIKPTGVKKYDQNINQKISIISELNIFLFKAYQS
jgi:hypothetical protein